MERTRFHHGLVDDGKEVINNYKRVENKHLYCRTFTLIFRTKRNEDLK